ncbi:hypothetical protein PR048_009342 [Dryococelus australis]|uniref:Uncharacterized protein n=1 Tax=Dryococelus australis TaxID=614101 RepID=A0ABQ9I1F8_9NEOP|nr:hypothetical protein PR048_009342 [Dryococelus australis]
MSHKIDGVDTSVLFASSTHSKAEQNYSQTPIEASGTRSGHPHLDSCQAARLQRWAVILAYDYKTVYRPGSLLANNDPGGSTSGLGCALELTKHGWANQIPDPSLKPYFHRRYELTLEQECLVGE